ncbi:alpha/beta fold hydrolase [Xylanimonas allomyrinae]|uniref:alpha/beta fold hydrolase n=1 Tax=Xylanimonas allomyrinae TaxID=2509459 RepID=UPI001B87B945|nr:alpha/beta hydrolase [Xylanimonas allomyrinae]
MAPIVTHRFGPAGAPRLVLVHGLTDAGTTWPDAVGRWQARWPLLAVDLRGHGASPRFTDDEPGDVAQRWTRDLRELLASLPEPPALVGHSLGAHLSLSVAAAAPGLVRAVVLEDPPLPCPGDNDSLPEFQAQQHRFLDAFAGGTDAEIGRMAAETPWSAREIHAWAACKPFVERAMIDRLELPERDWPALLETLAVPTLFVLPALGALAPFAARTSNPNVEAVVIDGAGHCVRRDAPAAYHAVVDPFLARHLTVDGPASQAR